MKLKIVKLQIIDYDANGEILKEYDLINPDKAKLEELKHMIEHRNDYMFAENISDEEFDKAEEFADNIWECINEFISTNFVVLNIDETYEIAY